MASATDSAQHSDPRSQQQPTGHGSTATQLQKLQPAVFAAQPVDAASGKPASVEGQESEAKLGTIDPDCVVSTVALEGKVTPASFISELTRLFPIFTGAIRVLGATGTHVTVQLLNSYLFKQFSADVSSKAASDLRATLIYDAAGMLTGTNVPAAITAPWSAAPIAPLPTPARIEPPSTAPLPQHALLPGANSFSGLGSSTSAPRLRTRPPIRNPSPYSLGGYLDHEDLLGLTPPPTRPAPAQVTNFNSQNYTSTAASDESASLALAQKLQADFDRQAQALQPTTDNNANSPAAAPQALSDSATEAKGASNNRDPNEHNIHRNPYNGTSLVSFAEIPAKQSCAVVPVALALQQIVRPSSNLSSTQPTHSVSTVWAHTSASRSNEPLTSLPSSLPALNSFKLGAGNALPPTNVRNPPDHSTLTAITSVVAPNPLVMPVSSPLNGTNSTMSETFSALATVEAGPHQPPNHAPAASDALNVSLLSGKERNQQKMSNEAIVSLEVRSVPTPTSLNVPQQNTPMLTDAGAASTLTKSKLSPARKKHKPKRPDYIAMRTLSFAQSLKDSAELTEEVNGKAQDFRAEPAVTRSQTLGHDVCSCCGTKPEDGQALTTGIGAQERCSQHAFCKTCLTQSTKDYCVVCMASIDCGCDNCTGKTTGDVDCSASARIVADTFVQDRRRLVFYVKERQAAEKHGIGTRKPSSRPRHHHNTRSKAGDGPNGVQAEDEKAQPPNATEDSQATIVGERPRETVVITPPQLSRLVRPRREPPPPLPQKNYKKWRHSARAIAEIGPVCREVPNSLLTDWSAMVTEAANDLVGAHQSNSMGDVEDITSNLLAMTAALRTPKGTPDSITQTLRQQIADTHRAYRAGLPLITAPQARVNSSGVEVKLPQASQGRPDAKIPDNVQANAIRRFNTCIRQRALKEATKALTGLPMLNLEDEKIQQQLGDLRTKAPAGDEMPSLEEGAPFAEVTTRDFVQALKQRRNTMGSGISGWTYRLWLDALQTDQARNVFTRIVNLIGSGLLPPFARELLLASKGIAFQKPNGKPRPIDIAEVFYRLPSAILVASISSEAAKILRPIQLAVGVNGGCHIAIHTAQAIIRDHNKRLAMVCLDSKNAFNSMSTPAMLRALFKQKSLSPVWRIAHWAYNQPTDTYLMSALHLVLNVLICENGVHQGDPLGSLLFCLGAQPAYIECLKAATDGEAVAIVDDLTVFAKPEDVQRIVETFNREGAKVGLQLQIDKTKIGWFHPEKVPEALEKWADTNGIEIELKALELLGAPIGCDVNAVQSMAIQLLADTEKLCTILRAEGNISNQAACEVLRLSANQKLAYLASAAHPSVTDVACVVFDRLILETFAERVDLDYDELTDFQKKRIRLPLREGGHGLRSIHDHALALWIAAHANAAQRISEVKGLDRKTDEAALGAAFRDLKQVLPRGSKWLSTPDTFIDTFAAAPVLAKDLSHKISAEITNQLVRQVTAQAKKDPVEYACLQQSKDSSSLWITTLPSHPSLKLPDFAHVTAVKQRYNITHRVLPKKCPLHCGADLKAQSHFVSCRSLHKDRIAMHDGVVRILYHWFKAMGCIVNLEVDCLNPENLDQRIDLYVTLPPGNTYLIDVAVLDPICKTYINRAARGIESVTEVRANQKYAKYQTMADHTQAEIIPFVVTVFGGFSDIATDFIDRVCAWALSQSGTTWVPGDILYGISRSVAIWLQVAASRMLHKGLVALEKQRD
jgi:hypothetical protein